MGLFDFFKKKEKTQTIIAPTMNGNTPFYSDFGTDIYASDIVVDTIYCKATEMKKLQPRHIMKTATNVTLKNDSSISRVLRRPNEFMTTADFLEKASILLELNKNVFIYPEYTLNKDFTKKFSALYILKPSLVEYLQDKSGRYYVSLEFYNSYKVVIPREDIIHWRKNYGTDDYFGGNGMGNSGLMRTVSEYDKLCQSISKAIQASCSINGVYSINSYLDDDKMQKRLDEFEERIHNNDSGILVKDLKAEYMPLSNDVKLVDADTLNYFYQSICRSSGVSVPILSGDYNKEQKEAFYEHALEADIISLGQAFTACIFSERECSYGNEIIFYPKEIAFMSMENKIAALSTGLPAGIFTKNEARELLGYPPIEGGDTMPRGYNELDDSTSTPDDGENDEGDERKMKVQYKRQFEKEKAKKETRYTTFAVRADDGEGEEGEKSLVLEGYAAVFDTETAIGEPPEWGFYEKIDKKAFDGADMSDVPLKYNHSDHVPILARTRNKSLELTVDEKGLKIKATLLDTQDSIDMYKKVKAGLLDKMSFAFTVKDYEVEEDDDGNVHRCITAFDRIFDVAIVDLPAYDDTEISADSRKQLENWKGSLESVKQQAKRKQNTHHIDSKTKQIILHYGGKIK